MFSRLDIDDERDRENELSNLSARPVFVKEENKESQLDNVILVYAGSSQRVCRLLCEGVRAFFWCMLHSKFAY